MNDARLIELLVASFAEQVATRLASELADTRPAAERAEPWRLLGLEEAAARLSRSPRWVREQVRRGALPVVRLDGGALGFELDDLQAFAQAHRVTGDVELNPPGRLRAVERGWLEQE